jgi:hypothetical protein
VGPEARSAVVMLNKELGLSQGKISRFFAIFFGIKLSRGGSSQIGLRVADRCEGTCRAIVKHVQSSAWAVPDETGWRIGGWLALLHVAVTHDAAAYLIARQRGTAASALLGRIRRQDDPRRLELLRPVLARRLSDEPGTPGAAIERKPERSPSRS